ncbi:MAG: hypothetical protein ACYCVL_01485 [Gemmatimonadaceae bacterium]
MRDSQESARTLLDQPLELPQPPKQVTVQPGIDRPEVSEEILASKEITALELYNDHPDSLPLVVSLDLRLVNDPRMTALVTDAVKLYEMRVL